MIIILYAMIYYIVITLYPWKYSALLVLCLTFYGGRVCVCVILFSTYSVLVCVVRVYICESLTVFLRGATSPSSLNISLALTHTAPRPFISVSATIACVGPLWS